MAQLRHGLAALAATTTSDPALLLGQLNRMLYDAGPEAGTATAVVAHYDPHARRLRWAQAGHPAPLLSRAGRTAELPRPRGPVLGAIREPGYGTDSATVQPGDLLIFYTDGLIERRGQTLAAGRAHLIEVVSRITAGPGQPALADVVRRLPPANPDDDTCVLAARMLEPPADLDGRAA
jgi:serine phosphatase RsbU (regulator of sigma subunit)